MNTYKNIINYENIKCNILQKEYKILSLMLYNIQKVIIENESILMYSKNVCMKTLNDLLKKLNEHYNKSIIEIFSNDKNTCPILSTDTIYINKNDIKSENISEEEVKPIQNYNINNMLHDNLTEMSSDNRMIIITIKVIKHKIRLIILIQIKCIDCLHQKLN